MSDMVKAVIALTVGIIIGNILYGFGKAALADTRVSAECAVEGRFEAPGRDHKETIVLTVWVCGQTRMATMDMKRGDDIRRYPPTFKEVPITEVY